MEHIDYAIYLYVDEESSTKQGPPAAGPHNCDKLAQTLPPTRTNGAVSARPRWYLNTQRKVTAMPPL
eukprot:scaffold23796_cov144-Isochrysis_galbana.AAC.4